MARPAPQSELSSPLLERADQMAALAQALSGVMQDARGRMVLIGGEAGVGKTALLREFCGAQPRVVWGGCDALFTPRPLGPLFQIGESLGGDLEELVPSGAKPHEVASELLMQLGSRRGTVLVLEDLHWADEATLDVLRLLARRIESAAVLVLGSYRDDELDPGHPLRIVLGELATRPGVERLHIEPLSSAAVASLATQHGLDPEKLHSQTGGNPFFLTEVLAAGGDQIPPTVRDAVLARAARLEPEARALIEAVAVVPPRAELWLLDALAPEAAGRLDECLSSGVLAATPGGAGFRHELARLAVEGAVAPGRRVELHRRALAALAAPPDGAPDLARLAHHAEAAADAPAVLRFAPAAAERAAALGAHREAAAQYARALRFAAREPAAERAKLLEGCSHECYLSAQLDEAVAAQEQALACWRDADDTLREGDAMRALARLLGFAGRGAEAEVACRQAIVLLESLDEPGPELARAYGKMAQRCMNWSDRAGAIEWGTRALALAERLERTETVAYVLTTIGAAELEGGSAAGRQTLERSLTISREAGLDDEAGRAFLNLASNYVRQRRMTDAEPYLSAGLAYCDERGLGYWWLSLLAFRACAELARADWSAAAASAESVIADPRHPTMAQGLSLAVLGIVRARRGDPGAWEALDEALKLARPTGELHQIAPVVAGMAEAAWLEGPPERAEAQIRETLELALRRDAAWEIGELTCWCRRLGLPSDIEALTRAAPYARELQGDPVEAARLWNELGCPYDAALALAGAGDESSLRQALEELHRLGARPAAAIVTRRLRALGVRGLPHGPRRTTRANRANLTPRELEVLSLLSEGLRNSEIAGRLFLSEKTVDHHVSAILRKLDVRTRGEAGMKAVRLGLVGEER